jgi:hypothetical protein
MLKGEAKTSYMRDYMRRKRAGQQTTKPKAPWEPSQRMINEITHWRYLRANRPRDLRGISREIIEGLTLDNDDSWQEACRRYKMLHDEQRRERRERREQREREEREGKVRHCSFCREPTSTERFFYGDQFDFPLICEVCVAEAAAVFAKQRSTV